MEDFIDAILFEREPISGMDLARDVVEAIYAAYVSAERGVRIELAGKCPASPALWAGGFKR